MLHEVMPSEFMMTRAAFLRRLASATAAWALASRLGFADDLAPKPLTNDSFQPGKKWFDTSGVPINAHGGGLLLHDGTYYWYGEFKIAGDAGNYAQVGISCYSSTDLYNWKNEGIVLPVSTEPGNPIEKGCILERPKVLFNKETNTFVMWTHHELKGHGYDAAPGCGRRGRQPARAVQIPAHLSPERPDVTRHDAVCRRGGPGVAGPVVGGQRDDALREAHR